MDFITAIFKPSDYSVQRNMDMERRMAPVLAAGKKADLGGLCERCDEIVGWFFLDPEVFREIMIGDKGAQIQRICNFEIKKLKPSCRICKFLYSIRPGKDEGVSGDYTLIRSTVGYMFRFMHTSDKSPIFFYLTSDMMPSYSLEGFGLPRENTHDTAFGFSNVNTYKDEVAIRHLSSNADLSLIRGWIRLCDDNHISSDFGCIPKVDAPIKGFTVIDCEDRRNILVPGTASMKYITLSYVWGAEVSDGPDQWGRLPATLPNLITGVIKVVITLGYRYLWIDRYCVPQTDSSGMKSLLLQNMDKIYSQSTLTIIAATTKCPSEELAGITKPRVVLQESLQLNSVHLVQLISNIQYEVEQSVWNTRGWTYQEALLSRRRLVFTETQCYFQCDAEGSQMESIDYGLKGYVFAEYGAGDYVIKEHGAREYLPWERGPGNYVLKKERRFKHNNRIPTIFPRRPKYSIDDKLSEFQRQVNAYTQRQLSKDSDVLPAFFGHLGYVHIRVVGFSWTHIWSADF